jgi:hypothetical protein
MDPLAVLASLLYFHIMKRTLTALVLALAAAPSCPVSPTKPSGR